MLASTYGYVVQDILKTLQYLPFALLCGGILLAAAWFLEMRFRLLRPREIKKVVSGSWFFAMSAKNFKKSSFF